MSEEKKYPKTALVKLGALWQQQGAKGVYWTGRTEDGVEFVMYVNGFRKAEKDPEFLLYTRVPDEEGKIAKNSSVAVTLGEVKPPKSKK